MTIQVAIVGTGPAGFYAAEALLKSDAECRIDMIDRLPTPFGLVRYGVAPDHQTTKRVTRVYTKILRREEVEFFGNVEVGRDVTLDELRSAYDAVVFATGAAHDRSLGIPGEDKGGVIGSASFVGWYNAHPDMRDLDPDLGCTAAAVIGNGNVAIDIARVLVKTRENMAESDLPPYAADAIARSPLRDVYMFGRRGPIEAKFTNVELREMGHLEDALAVVDPAQLPDDVGDLPEGRDRRLKEKNLATLKGFAAQAGREVARRAHFAFFATPVEILGGDRVEGLRLERTRVVAGRAVGTGEFFEIPCGLVIPAVGYRSIAVEGLPFDEKSATIPNHDGRVEPGIYVVGWIKRGPSGVIGTNRPDGVKVAGHIVSDCRDSGKPAGHRLRSLLAGRGVGPVSFADWEAIDAAEIAAAVPPAPRRKFETVAAMLSVLEAPAAPALAVSGSDPE